MNKDYYPFGKEHENPNLASSTNRWGFSGKEKQTVRDLGWLDFMARMYSNSEIPIFTTQDPLSEKYYSVSPYAYCAGNPLRYIDPDGKQMSTAIRFLRNPLKFIKTIKLVILGSGTGVIYNHFVDRDKSAEVANSLIDRAKSIDEARASSQEQIDYQKRQQSLSDAEEVDISAKHNQNMKDNNSDGDGNGKGGKPKGGTIMKIVGGTAATIGVIEQLSNPDPSKDAHEAHIEKNQEQQNNEQSHNTNETNVFYKIITWIQNQLQ
jgi:RHS repeat-associated protein